MRLSILGWIQRPAGRWGVSLERLDTGGFWDQDQKWCDISLPHSTGQSPSWVCTDCQGGWEGEAVCISRRKREMVWWTARQFLPHVLFDLIYDSKKCIFNELNVYIFLWLFHWHPKHFYIQLGPNIEMFWMVEDLMGNSLYWGLPYIQAEGWFLDLERCLH